MERDGVALFVDWENIKISLKDQLGIRPSPRLLRKFAARYGSVTVGRAYANWSDHGKDGEYLFKEGVVPVFALAGKVAGETTKNSVDVLLAAECAQLAITNLAIRTIVLAGGDFAYANLVPIAHSAGKRVIVVAATRSASLVLSRLADEFVPYEALIAGFDTAAERSLPPGEKRKRTERTREALKALSEAVDELRTPLADGTLLEHDAAALKNLIRRQLPDFREEDIGFERFRHFLFTGERAGHVLVDTREEHPVIYRPDEVQTDTGRPILSSKEWDYIVENLPPYCLRTEAINRVGEHNITVAEESGFVHSFDVRGQVQEPPKRYCEISQYDERAQVYLAAARGAKRA